MKQGNFKWIVATRKSYSDMKKKVTKKRILVLPNFDEVFQFGCDAIGTTNGEVLSQEGRLIEFFSQNLIDAMKKYYANDQEIYVIVQPLKKWRHCFFPKEFLLFTDHKELQYINSQGKLNQRNYTCVEFLQIYTFFLKYRSKNSSKVVDFLSRRVLLFNTLSVEVVSLVSMKEFNAKDVDFGENT